MSIQENIPINQIENGGDDGDGGEYDDSSERDSALSKVEGKCSGMHPVLRIFLCPGLPLQTLYGVLLGFFLGTGLRPYNPSPLVMTLFSYPGELFISSLKMVVIPMIVCGMILAVIQLGDIKKIKLLGTRALTYYLCTTFFACLEGLIMVELFQPGVAYGNKQMKLNITESDRGSDTLLTPQCYVHSPLLTEKTACYPSFPEKGPEDSILDLGRSMLPSNLITAYQEMNILGLIVFSVLFGIQVSKQKNTEVLLNFFEVSYNACMGIVMLIIKFTPIGIFSLVIGEILRIEDLWGLIESLAEFVGATTTGILLHLLFFYPAVYFITTRKNPYPMLAKMTAPMLTAFATSSSAATLPVTVDTAEKNGVNPQIAKFIIPLGATINMDGTAIYFPIAVIYLANSMGTVLSFGDKLGIAFVSALISVGAAPIPSAGVVYLVLIMGSVGVRVSGSITFVLSIDWLLDRMQTACNVTGDGFGALILEHYRQKDASNLNAVLAVDDKDDDKDGKEGKEDPGETAIEEH